jgi:hypothetical protein
MDEPPGVLSVGQLGSSLGFCSPANTMPSNNTSDSVPPLFHVVPAWRPCQGHKNKTTISSSSLGVYLSLLLGPRGEITPVPGGTTLACSCSCSRFAQESAFLPLPMRFLHGTGIRDPTCLVPIWPWRPLEGPSSQGPAEQAGESYFQPTYFAKAGYPS